MPARATDSAERPFNRPPRILRQLPAAEVALPPPPQLPNFPNQRWQMLLPPLLMAGTYLLVASMRSSSGGSSNLLFLIPMVLMALTTAGMSAWTFFDQRRQYRLQYDQAIKLWETAVKEATAKLEALHQRQFTVRHANDPEIIVEDLQQQLEKEQGQEGRAALRQALKLYEQWHTPELIKLGIQPIEHIVENQIERLWERRPEDNDFLFLRIGLGARATTTEIKPPSSPTINEYVRAMEKLADQYAFVDYVPVHAPLPLAGSLGVVGGQHQRLAAVQALVWQIVAHHSPSDVRIVGFWSERESEAWRWLSYLPHVQSLQGEDRYRLLAHWEDQFHEDKARREYFAEVAAELQRELQQRAQQKAEGRFHLPYLVVIATEYDDYGETLAPLQTILRSGQALGASALCLVNRVADVPSECGGYIDVRERELALSGAESWSGRSALRSVDGAQIERSQRLANSLIGMPMPETNSSRDLPHRVDLHDLLHIHDVLDFDPGVLWDDIPPNDSDHPSGLHPVPIGKSGPREEDVIFLDLNEKREGVHGMLAGTTGSGKSEFLITLLLSLALRHSPDRLNFLLIDFKGGATFDPLKHLPHTSGFVTDLSGSQADRALLAINSELDRRKTLFMSRPDVNNIRSYRKQGGSIPNLVIAIDEFDEMVNDHEGVVDELIRVAKQGRSLGVHLLFATQQPSNGKIKAGLKANLTYWVSLRVVDPEDSQLMIGSKAAAAIPNNVPGRGYKRVDKNVTPFQSAIITLPYTPPREREGMRLIERDATGRQIGVLSLKAQSDANESQQRDPASKIVIKRMAESRPAEEGEPYAARHYRIWCAPFASNITLADVLKEPQASRTLQVEIGKIDYPEQAEQVPFVLDLPTYGSMLVIGSSGAGKTAFLQTCVLALAKNWSLQDIAFYIADRNGTGLGLAAVQGHNGSQTMRPLLPHIADVVSHKNTIKVERLFNVLNDEIREREAKFQAAKVDSWLAYRTQHPSDTMPALVVVIDNLLEFLQNSGPAQLIDIVRGAKSFGIYVLMTIDRLTTSTVPNDLQKNIGQQVVLRLNSKEDSEALLNKAFAYYLNPHDYGRGYIPEFPMPREVQFAYPTLRDRAQVQAELDALGLRQAEAEAAARGEAHDPDHVPPALPLASLDRQGAIEDAAEQISKRFPGQKTPALPLEILDSYIPANPAAWQGSNGQGEPEIIVARDNRRLQQASISFKRTPHLFIAGGPRTGKSNVLQTLLAGLVNRMEPEELELYLVDYRDHVLAPFKELKHTRAFATSSDEFKGDFAKQLKEAIDARQQALKENRRTTLPSRIIVAISKSELVENDMMGMAVWGQWANQSSRLRLSFVFTGNDFQVAQGWPVIKAMKQERSGILLGTFEPMLWNNLGLGNKGNIKMPPTMDGIVGRGFLVENGREQLVQFWHTDEPTLERVLEPHQAPPEPVEIAPEDPSSTN